MDCIFCQIADGKIPTQFLMETDTIVAFRDIQPAAPVHILIIPKKHIETLNDLGDSEVGLMGQMVKAATELAKKQGIAESGYRLIMNCNKDGGQEVFHIHLHLLGGCPIGGLAQKR